MFLCIASNVIFSYLRLKFKFASATFVKLSCCHSFILLVSECLVSGYPGYHTYALTFQYFSSAIQTPKLCFKLTSRSIPQYVASCLPICTTFSPSGFSPPHLSHFVNMIFVTSCGWGLNMSIFEAEPRCHSLDPSAPRFELYFHGSYLYFVGY